jgi:hypothetical protein
MVLPVKPGLEGLSGSSKKRPFAVLLKQKGRKNDTGTNREGRGGEWIRQTIRNMIREFFSDFGRFS